MTKFKKFKKCTIVLKTSEQWADLGVLARAAYADKHIERLVELRKHAEAGTNPPSNNRARSYAINFIQGLIYGGDITTAGSLHELGCAICQNDIGAIGGQMEAMHLWPASDARDWLIKFAEGVLDIQNKLGKMPPNSKEAQARVDAADYRCTEAGQAETQAENAAYRAKETKQQSVEDADHPGTFYGILQGYTEMGMWENFAMEMDPREVKLTLARCKELGISTKIHDYGKSGYMS